MSASLGQNPVIALILASTELALLTPSSGAEDGGE